MGILGVSCKRHFDMSDARQGKYAALSGVLYGALRQIDAQTCKISNPFYIYIRLWGASLLYIYKYFYFISRKISVLAYKGRKYKGSGAFWERLKNVLLMRLAV